MMMLEALSKSIEGQHPHNIFRRVNVKPRQRQNPKPTTFSRCHFIHAFHALNDATIAPAKYYEMSEKAYEEYRAKEMSRAEEKKKGGKKK